MKFSIRDLMWLTVVVALAVGWWMERRARSQQEEAFRKMLVEVAAELGEKEMELVTLRGVSPLKD